MYFKIILCIIIAGTVMAAPEAADAQYKITLKNGETMQADEFCMDNSKITVKLKGGSVSFPISGLYTVTDPEGRYSVFSAQPKAEPQLPQAVPEQGQPAPAPAPAPA
ncbi:MAG TPA: hypothetical protein VGK71_03870, partial [Nitrospirota bacterium]